MAALANSRSVYSSGRMAGAAACERCGNGASFWGASKTHPRSEPMLSTSQMDNCKETQAALSNLLTRRAPSLLALPGNYRECRDQRKVQLGSERRAASNWRMIMAHSGLCRRRRCRQMVRPANV